MLDLYRVRTLDLYLTTCQTGVFNGMSVDWLIRLSHSQRVLVQRCVVQLFGGRDVVVGISERGVVNEFVIALPFALRSESLFKHAINTFIQYGPDHQTRKKRL